MIHSSGCCIGTNVVGVDEDDAAPALALVPALAVGSGGSGGTGGGGGGGALADEDDAALASMAHTNTHRQQIGQ